MEVPLPDAPARAAFLSAMLARPEINSHLSDSELETLTAATEGFSGSDMAAVCRQAAMAPLRELFQQGGSGKRRRLKFDAGGSSADDGDGQEEEEGASRQGPELKVRQLVVGDFLAALLKIRPAALDAKDGGCKEATS
jgi:SpoVK/Ycf46/Vps4 family AAA+-type ATPase